MFWYVCAALHTNIMYIHTRICFVTQIYQLNYQKRGWKNTQENENLRHRYTYTNATQNYLRIYLRSAFVCVRPFIHTRIHLCVACVHAISTLTLWFLRFHHTVMHKVTNTEAACETARLICVKCICVCVYASYRNVDSSTCELLVWYSQATDQY